MKIIFWGTRGSIPTPGETTVKYGGNTPCVELRFDDDNFIILDAGTGIRNLGEKIIESGSSINTYVLISHPHWDHIQGFPFFKPAFISGNEITIVCAEFDGISLPQMISDQMNKAYFPIQLNELKANINFKSVREEEFDVFGANVKTLFLNHPLFAIGYRITYRNKSITYISDNEPFDRYVAQTIKNVHTEIIKKYLEYKNEPNQHLFDFVMGSDILIYDSTYTPEEYIDRVGWGHSHYLFSLKVAAEGNVKNLVLFHHDPSHNDAKIDEIYSKCLKEIKNRNYKFLCHPAYEGFVMNLNT
ncbi:MAG: MBL fold metallo-hydrolase [Bacteroidetes bacterium]|nr:MBL fold metallo-hydrolase [Bacteroidota bacterium]MBU1422292.1 MBL fold metallo-hydrolase [Bacteroidota bacterium]MBU2472181.1 MBL fold metallo-hydrolase [Bacteroidota bacterium]MBU2636343.1 MBL fold metallo-hydrolase [Bacteroidota bacterium]